MVTWIRTHDNLILRSDLLTGFIFEGAQVNLRMVSPRTSLGGPESRRTSIFGLFMIAPRAQTSEKHLLAQGYKTPDEAVKAIESFLQAIRMGGDGILIHEIPSL